MLLTNSHFPDIATRPIILDAPVRPPDIAAGSDGEREAELRAAEAARRQKQRYVDGFKRRNGGAGRPATAARAPATVAPPIVRPIPRVRLICCVPAAALLTALQVYVVQVSHY